MIKGEKQNIASLTRTVQLNPQLVIDFYQDLSKAYNVPARYEIYFGGDFNAKVGKLTEEELASDVLIHVGRFCVGTRNSSGESLLNFVVENDLFYL